MRQILILWRRELGGFFVSPVVYMVSAMFLVVMGTGFWFVASYRLLDGATIYDVLRALYGGVAWFAMLMVVPVLTMRSFAEETRSGTMETLLTAPVRDGAVVLAKFLGVLTVYLLMWLPTLGYLVILNDLNDQQTALELGALSSTGVGLMLVGMFFLSIGLFCSVLTRNLMISAIATFAATGVIFIAGFLPEVSPVPWVREVTAPFSPVLHMLDFARGIVDTRAVVLYLTGTGMMLMFTTRVLESRRWRA